jgi:hypothetical protein
MTGSPSSGAAWSESREVRRTIEGARGEQTYAA